jgi:hypothetical protein
MSSQIHELTKAASFSILNAVSGTLNVLATLTPTAVASAVVSLIQVHIPSNLTG